MYDSIVTDGVNKTQIDAQGLADGAAGRLGTTNRARMLNGSHREIHLRDADAVIEYNNQFSDRSLGAAFFSHLQGNARDVALINELGPNPEVTFSTLKNTVEKRDSQMPGAVFNKKVAWKVLGGQDSARTLILGRWFRTMPTWIDGIVTAVR